MEAVANDTDRLMAQNVNNPYAADERLHVIFRAVPVEDEEKSAIAGRPIFREVDYITIRTPGDRDNILDRPMTKFDKDRFSKRYEMWKKGTAEQMSDGTPLSVWPVMPRTVVEEMKYFGVHTVEQLAQLQDGHIKKSRELFPWRQKAQDWLALAENGAAATKLRAEKEALENRFKAQEQALAEQAKIIMALQAKLGV